MELRILTGADVRQAIDMAEAIEAMRAAFAELSSGQAQVPERQTVSTDSGLTLVMPAYLASERALGAKIVSVFEGNRKSGLPVITGLVVLLEATTGAPVALLEAAELTALRTGAAAGLATSLLASETASVLALFGAGPQARAQLEAMRCVRPVREVRVVARTRESAIRFATQAASEHPDLVVEVPTDPDVALRGADLIVTATTSAAPVFRGSDVEMGCHVNGIGSFRADTREVDTELVQRARVVVDSRAAALAEAGDLLIPIDEGAIGEDHIGAELGEIVLGHSPPGPEGRDITFFKSVGNAAQDMAVARRIVEQAAAVGIGTLVEI
ncbi:MAG: ornithine cyclodeaminase family protein [Gemmatimonadota bacterium]|nr:MAG: ornithine cyclodeaminase family protein [Gemmatimonadota bacterium]